MIPGRWLPQKTPWVLSAAVHLPGVNLGAAQGGFAGKGKLVRLGQVCARQEASLTPLMSAAVTCTGPEVRARRSALHPLQMEPCQQGLLQRWLQGA